MAFSFRDITGNASLKQEIAKLIQIGEMPHASIFYGPEGSAKLRMALATARMLLCENPTEDDVCENCSSCGKTAKLAHPDLHFCFPTIGKDALSDAYMDKWRASVTTHPDIGLYDWLKNGGFETKSVNLKGNINSKNIREAAKKLEYKSYEGGNRVLLIWMSELMGKEGNILLKLFEEPPDNTYILLVSERLNDNLITILSRAPHFKINKYTTAEIKAMLIDKGIEPHQVNQIAPNVHGNMNEALNMALDSDEQWLEQWSFPRWASFIMKNNAVEIFKMADQFSKLNLEQRKYFINHCNRFIDLAIKTKLLGTAETYHLRPAETEFIRNFANALEPEQFYAMCSVLDKAVLYINRNANAQILFVALSFQLERYLKTMAALTA